MERYGVIDAVGDPREIVLLKGAPCVWGKCAFCDYIADNGDDPSENFKVNSAALARVKGIYGALEVINSGSVFELDRDTLTLIKDTIADKNIGVLYCECYWAYRNRLDEIREFFGVPVIFKCGIETFDDDFRNRVLKKGIVYDSIEEIKKYFESVCIMVGIEGQTRASIERDMDILLGNFKYGCVNVYCNNGTSIKRDDALAEWFDGKYGNMLRALPNIDYLYKNTDFGVGEEV